MKKETVNHDESSLFKLLDDILDMMISAGDSKHLASVMFTGTLLKMNPSLLSGVIEILGSGDVSVLIDVIDEVYKPVIKFKLVGLQTRPVAYPTQGRHYEDYIKAIDFCVEPINEEAIQAEIKRGEPQ